MCGIFGIIGAVEPLELKRMGDCLRHRGPDDEGYVLFESGDRASVAARGDETVPELSRLPRLADLPSDRTRRGALGHRRLSIIDPGAGGHQPMSTRDGRYWIVYNGELYNFRSLRRELEAKAYRFLTNSDTEVLLAAFTEWGFDSLSRLNGMFAFAIGDAVSGEVFIARDRFGIKPVYYRLDENGLVFASEIKAIHAIRPRVLNEQSLYHSLCSGKIPEAPQTFYRDVELLEPGFYLRFKHGNVQKSRWYAAPVPPGPLADLSRDFSAETSEFGRLFDQSVHAHLVADVPVAFCLSGGLDSSSIVSVVAKGGQFTDEMHTFSAIFPGESCDENEWMDVVVSQTQTRPHYTSPEPMDLLSEFERLTRHQDEPVIDPTLFTEWCVMKSVHESGIKVVLNGHGADEMLAGYEPGLSRFLQQVRREKGEGAYREELNLFRRNCSYAFLQEEGIRQENAPESPPILAGDFHRANAGSGRSAPSAEDNFNALLSNQFFRSSLPHQLVWADNNSMAFSVECRVPFLEPALTEFTFGQPGNFKMHAGWTKWPLRSSLAGVLPDRIRWRTTKFGYTTPDASWWPRLKTPLLDLVRGAAPRTSAFLDIDLVIKAAESARSERDRRRFFRAAAVSVFLSV